ncbi:MAG: D-alanyl-D-alanine carboxypeptidase family protein [Devosia marina]|uniref:D-alanyl-D-alanine carboxypeptidase family protein n=1 Tax=Devosia marina TaxID=2683198 RepID=UPI0032ED26B4
MADVIDVLIAEALGEGPEGMAAVAHVINARAIATGKTPEQIVNESGQFTGATNPGRVVAQSMRDPATRQQVSQIWEGVQSGSIANPFPRASHFHTPAVSPDWSNSFERLGQYGNHIFYADGSVPAQQPQQQPRRVEPSMPVMRPADTAVAAIEQASPAWDWAQYATGGAAARPDSFTGLNDPFSQALQQMLSDAPEDVRINITSAYRSPETQERLWKEALEKYGSEREARRWVAPPGRSQHNHGNAVDLKYLSPAAQAWAHENAEKYGLAFPLSNEPWHLELGAARGGPALAYAGNTTPAVMRAQAQPAKQGGGFWGGITGPIKTAMGGIGAPIMTAASSPNVQRQMVGNMFGTVGGRTAIMKALMNQNIGSAPNVSQGHSGPGTRAMAVSGGKAAPVMLASRQSSQSHPSSSANPNAHMNMSVYRANAAVLGGGGFNQSNIDRALSSGKTLYKLA